MPTKRSDETTSSDVTSELFEDAVDTFRSSLIAPDAGPSLMPSLSHPSSNRPSASVESHCAAVIGFTSTTSASNSSDCASAQQRKCGRKKVCCGLVQVRHVAIVLGVVEIVFFASQLIIAFVDLFDNADDFGTKSAHGTTTLSTLLTIASLTLAIVAAMLLLFGVQLRSPFLLVPHIYMQFAFMIASLVVIVYLFSWWFGGFKIHFFAIVFGNSEKGHQFDLLAAKDWSPIRGNFAVDEFNVIVLIMIIFSGIFCVVQLWLYQLMINLFREMLKQPKQI